MCRTRLARPPGGNVLLASLVSSMWLGVGLAGVEVDGTWEQRATRWLTVTPFRKAVNAKGSTKDTSTFTCKGNSMAYGGGPKAL